MRANEMERRLIVSLFKGLSTLDTLSRSDPDKSTSVASTLHAHCAKPGSIRIDLNPLP